VKQLQKSKKVELATSGCNTPMTPTSIMIHKEGAVKLNKIEQSKESLIKWINDCKYIQKLNRQEKA